MKTPGIVGKPDELRWPPLNSAFKYLNKSAG